MSGFGFGLQGLASGLAQGIDLADRMEDRKLNRERMVKHDERLARLDEREAQRFEWQKDETALRQKLAQFQMEQLEDDAFRKQWLRSADAFELHMERMQDPQFMQQLQSDPNLMRQVQAQSQQYLKTLTAPWIQRGGPDGTSKSWHRLVPLANPDEITDPEKTPIGIQLEVTRPDGSKYYPALTNNRTGDPDDDPYVTTMPELMGAFGQARYVASRLDELRAQMGVDVMGQRRAVAEKQAARDHDMAKIQAQGENSVRTAHISGQYGLQQARVRAAGAGGSGKPTALITNVEWAARHLTNGDMDAAFRRVQEAKNNPKEAAAKLFLEEKRRAAQAAEMGIEPPSDQEIMQQVQHVVRMLYDGGAGSSDPEAAAPSEIRTIGEAHGESPNVGKIERPLGGGRGLIRQTGNTQAQGAPSQPERFTLPPVESRVPGKTTINHPQHGVLIWDGKQWQKAEA